jgi:hypothetical protein
MINDDVRTPSTDTYQEHGKCEHESRTRITNTRVNVKLPTYKVGLTGHLPAKVLRWESLENWKTIFEQRGATFSTISSILCQASVHLCLPQGLLEEKETEGEHDPREEQQGEDIREELHCGIPL